MTLIKNNVDIQPDDLCIEPSAGDGAFINSIKSTFKHYVFYDISPEHDDILQQDYLNLTIPPNKRIHVIGNPPFGRQSSLAIKFIKKSTSFCNSLSFILPKSFKKDSLKKHFPLSFHLKIEYDLSKNAFIVDNKCYDVPCVFQIWVKCDTNRFIQDKLTPNGFQFVKKNVAHDISFRRVGVNAGYIDKNTLLKSEQSHYFIKFNEPFTESQFEKLSTITYSCKENTVGPKSISKQELMKGFNMTNAFTAFNI
jgi:hypothetical protein